MTWQAYMYHYDPVGRKSLLFSVGCTVLEISAILDFKMLTNMLVILAEIVYVSLWPYGPKHTFLTLDAPFSRYRFFSYSKFWQICVSFSMVSVCLMNSFWRSPYIGRFVGHFVFLQICLVILDAVVYVLLLLYGQKYNSFLASLFSICRVILDGFCN